LVFLEGVDKDKFKIGEKMNNGLVTFLNNYGCNFQNNEQVVSQ